MSQRSAFLSACLLAICCVLPISAQQPLASVNNRSKVVVPPLVNFSGVLTDVNGKPLTNITGVTFLLYEEQQGGPPLWMETQNVQPERNGHYAVMLGSTTSTGCPPTSLWRAKRAGSEYSRKGKRNMPGSCC